MTTKAKLNPKDIQDEKFEQKAQLKEVETKIYQTMEVSALLTQITEHNFRVEELKSKIADIEDKRKDEKDLYLKASMKLEKDLDAKTNECNDLVQELANTKKDYENKIVKIIAQKDEELSGLKSEMERAKFELGKKISELSEELRGLKEFKERQEEYYAQMAEWKRKHDELIHNHNDDLKRIDNRNSKAIQMQEDKHSKEKSQILHEAKREAEKEVEKLDKKVIEDNKKLKLDLVEYKKEVEALKAEKEKMYMEMNKVKQNMTLNEDEVVEYQAIHYRQENKIRTLKEKVQVLKNYIAQEVNKHTKETEGFKHQTQIHMKELEIQNQTLKDELMLKMREAKNLKALSQIILDQRSEIEEFLLETIDHVKAEVKKHSGSDKKTRLPEIISKSKTEAKPRKTWERMDFSSLDWEDKEKILRVLFSKMNAGNGPSHWRSFTTGDRSGEGSERSFKGGLGGSKVHSVSYKGLNQSEVVKGMGAGVL